METITFQETQYEWSELQMYYQNIKKLYNLTSHDIVNQLTKSRPINTST